MHINTPAGNLVIDPADLRSELRQLTPGKVQLKFEGEPQSEVEMDLMDTSPSGFRVKHQYGALPLGAKATFRHARAAGKARVVWNWLSSDHMETGFVIPR